MITGLSSCATVGSSPKSGLMSVLAKERAGVKQQREPRFLLVLFVCTARLVGSGRLSDLPIHIIQYPIVVV